MHISRSIENCKAVYGTEFISMKKDQKLKRTEYLKNHNKKYHEESYNPDKRRVKYLKEKKSNEKIEENIRKNIADEKEKKLFHNKRKRKRLAQEKWYENNSEKIKKKRTDSYDPGKRSAIYQKKKTHDQKIAEMYDSDEDSDELAKNVFVQAYHERRKYKKQWYKDNAQEISESYDPEKRKTNYRVCNK